MVTHYPIDRRNEESAPMAVAGAMVGRKGCDDGRPRPHHPAGRPWTLYDFAETDQRDLRRIDYSEDRLDPLLAEAGNRDGRVCDLRAAQHASSHPFHEVAQIHHDLVEALLVDIVNCRRDESPQAK